jgi:proteasome activator subunit 4
MSLYKFSFSLDDHINLCKLLLDVLLIDGLDYSYQERLAGVLRKLIHKSDVLPSSAMVIPWRPFYDLLSKLYFGKLRGTTEIHKQHGTAICKLVRDARRFFAPEATSEIMATLRPLLCPHDETIYRAACFMSMMLPTNAADPAGVAPEFLSWIDEVMHIWTWIENLRDWDLCWISLLGRVAKQNPGRIDWNPMLPWLFTKFLGAFALPVGSGQSSAPYQHNLPSNVVMLLPYGAGREAKIAQMIVSMIIPGNNTLDYLQKMLAATNAFFHPSNTGNWSAYLGVLIYKLTEAFAERLHKERQPDCMTPAEARLTDVECQTFCKTLLPVMHLAMYGKSVHMITGAAYGARHLSFICPEIIIPSFIDKIYVALQTLTETHQTVSALSVLLNIVRPMFWKDHYKDGGKHLLPILQLCLPGIDPNDALKTQHTLAVYMTIFANVTFIDCSTASVPDSASDDDRQLYADTAMFEDWSLQFLDRLFAVLETMVAASSKVNSTERGLGHIIPVSGRDFFQQLSLPLYEVGMKKLKEWVMSSCLVHVGKAAGTLCAGAVRAHPKIGLGILLPDLCGKVIPLLADYPTVDEAGTSDDKVDEELLWFMNVLVRVVKYGGAALLDHREMLLAVFDRALRLAPYKASKLAGKMFRHVLKSLTTLYPLESRSLSPTQLKECEGDPIKLFDLRGSVVGPSDELDVQWHQTTPEELAFAEELVARYYDPAMADLTNLVDKGSASPPNTELIRVNLMIVRNVVRVGESLMPELEGDPSYFAHGSTIKQILPELTLFAKGHARSQAGEGRRKAVCDVLHRLSVYYLAEKEDDIKTCKTIIKIMKQLLCFRGVAERKYAHGMKSYQMIKRQYEDVNHGKKMHYRGLLVSRVWLQHAHRMSTRRISTPYTDTYRALVADLVLLGTSRYAKVREHAQTSLFSTMAVFVQAKRDVVPLVMKLVNVGKEEHEDKHQQIKGALHILGHSTIAKALNLDWDFLRDFLQTVPLLHSNEKQTIQALVGKSFGTLRAQFRTRSLELVIPESCFKHALAFCPAISDLTAHFEGAGVAEIAKANAAYTDQFVGLVDKLVGMLADDSVGWKFGLMLSGSLFALLRDDRPVPLAIAQFYFRNLTSDLINVRGMGSRAVSIILAISKKKALKGPFAGTAGSAGAISSQQAGCRPDNVGHCFKNAVTDRPTTKAALDATIYVDKNYTAWNGWPVGFKTYLAKSEQPSLQITDIDMCCEEYFGDPAFVTKWIDFAAQAQSDGSAPPFSDSRAEMFKGIARNFGLKALEFFRSDVERLLVEDPADGTGEHASKLRCVAEIMAGLIRGSKHWEHDEIQALWAWAIPILKTLLPTLSNLSIGNWSGMIRFCVYDRDPRRLYPLTDLLFAPALTMDESDTSFGQFRCLLFLHTAMEELSWRGVEPALKLLEDVKPFVGHPYKLVREKISRCLFVAMRATWDPMLTAPEFSGPRPAVAEGAPVHQIRQLTTEFAERISAARAPTDDKDARRNATNVAKTVLQWVTIAFNDGSSPSLVPHLDALLPCLFSLPETNPEDDELGNLTTQALGFAAQMVLPHGSCAAYAKAVISVGTDPSWHARKRVLHFLQVLVFRNLFVAPIKLVTDLVVTLLKDEQLEVRELAGETLGGLVRCGVVKDKLRNQFIKLAKTEIRKAPLRRRPNDPPMAPLSDAEKAAVIDRHAGLLGLNAFLSAHPYDIPEWMPSTLIFVCDYVNDPEPIKKTVKKSIGEFWRTHQENKAAVKEAFDSDDYDMLSDLVVGHNYYA